MTKHDNVSREGIMKATEFVKKHGWGETQRIIQDYPSHTHVTSDARMFINEHFCIEEIKHQLVGLVKICDLKRLIESHELVGNFGGLKRAKRILKKSYTSFNTMVSVVWNDKPFQCTVQQLEQAVSDVEACQ